MIKSKKQLELDLVKARKEERLVQSKISTIFKDIEKIEEQKISTLLLILRQYIGRAFLQPSNLAAITNYYFIYNAISVGQVVSLHIYHVKLNSNSSLSIPPPLPSRFSSEFRKDEVGSCLGREISKEEWLEALEENKLQIIGHIQQIAEHIKE